MTYLSPNHFPANLAADSKLAAEVVAIIANSEVAGPSLGGVILLTNPAPQPSRAVRRAAR